MRPLTSVLEALHTQIDLGFASKMHKSPAGKILQTRGCWACITAYGLLWSSFVPLPGSLCNFLESCARVQ